jgi:uncharacterized protein
MSKLVFWLVIVFGVLFVLRLLNLSRAKKRAQGARPKQAATPQIPEAMVRCARCGVYLPKSETRFGPGGLTCGDPGCQKRR